jgi:hypothetical protein
MIPKREIITQFRSIGLFMLFRGKWEEISEAVLLESILKVVFGIQY